MADANPTERTIELNDTDLLQMVQQKGEMVEHGRSIARMMEDLQQQLEKLTGEMAEQTTKVIDIKRKIFKRIGELSRDQLTEYEIPITTDIREGKLVLVINDALADFKESFKGFDKFAEPVPLPKKPLAAQSK